MGLHNDAAVVAECGDMKRGRVRLALEAVAESGGMKREAVRLAP